MRILARCRWPAAFVVACVAASARAADTQERPLSEILAVSGGGECLAPDALAEQVASWLGRDEADARLRIEVAVHGDPPALVEFVVEVDGVPRAQRDFTDLPAQCADVRAVVALAVALAIDATLLEGIGVGPVEKVAPFERQSRVALEAMASAGLVPDLVMGGDVAWEVAWSERFESRVGVLLTAPADAELDPGRVERWLAAGRVEVCLARSLGAERLRACAGPAAGVVLARGRAFDRPRSTQVPWVAVSARIDARFALGAGVDLGLALEGFVPVVRPRLVVEGPAGVGVVAAEDASPVGIAVAVGPAFAF